MSATLAANEEVARRIARGEPVLPLAFGEAGLPVPALLRAELAAAAGLGGYGPVAGRPALREAAAGYWARRGLPTSPADVVCGPGSKPLLFGLLLALGSEVAVPRPSWVSYAAQAALAGTRAHFVPAPPGQGGMPDPELLERAVRGARARGARIGSVIVTLPDNPTGTLASQQTVCRLCEVAARHDLAIISDEIYRDLVHDPVSPFPTPAAVAPERTIVTTGLSKNLALGGWRLGVARLPAAGHAEPWAAGLAGALSGIASEIWSAPAAPVQQAAAVAFGEPPEITERVDRSRRLHAAVARAVAERLRAAGLAVPGPQGAFYLYPDFGAWAGRLESRHGVTTSAGLADLLLGQHGAAVLPGSAFGDDPGALRLRLATSLLYGSSDAEREAALGAADPLMLPPVAGALSRLEEILASLGGRAAAGSGLHREQVGALGRPAVS